MKEFVTELFAAVVWLDGLLTLAGLSAIFATPVLSYLALWLLWQSPLTYNGSAYLIVGFASVPLTALAMLAMLGVTIALGRWMRRTVAAQVTRNQPDRPVVIL